MKAEMDTKAAETKDSEKKDDTPKASVKRYIKARGHITNLADLDTLIKELQRVRSELHFAHTFELDLKLED
jgi:hypothetical protein